MAETKVTPIELYNPYKFSVYRNLSVNTGASTTVRIAFDTKIFDTSSNFDNTTNYRFTAPVSGFYFLSWQIALTAGSTDTSASLYKNGSLYAEGANTTSSGSGVAGSSLVQAIAGDYYEIWLYTNSGTSALRTTNKGVNFQGFMVSIT